MTLVWSSDPEFRLGKLDAVSAWIGGWGNDFFAALPDSAGVSPDFQFAALFDAADPGSVFKRNDGGPKKVVVLVQSTQDASGKETDAAALSAKLGMTDPRLVLLPLPARALPPEVLMDRNRLVETSDTIEPASPPPGTKPPKAVIGIIDYGINFAHHRFRAGAGTRVLNAWVQDGAASGDRTVPFGREWGAAEHDSLYAAVDGSEADLLRRMGCHDFADISPRALSFQKSHGTHVLDLAAGFDPAEDRADLPILAVSLPAAVAWESSGAFLSLFFLMGLEFLLARCRAVGDKIPLFVNFSFGLSGGPRGGAHLIDRGIDALIAQHRSLGGGEVIMTLPAGNRNLALGHAAPLPTTTGQNAQFSLTWYIPPGDPSSNSLEMWLRRGQHGTPVNGEISLTLVPPDGGLAPEPQRLKAVSDPILLRQEPDASRPHSVLLRTSPDALPIGRATLRRDIATGALALNLVLAPTDPRRTGRDPTPAGAWTVIIDSSDNAPDTLNFQAWVLRDDTLPGFRDTRLQSTFVDPAYRARSPEGFPEVSDRVADAIVRRAGTMNSIATGQVPTELADHHARISVGGMLGASGAVRQMKPAPYSASPLPANESWAEAERVDCWAECDRSAIRPGVLGAGTFSGTRHALNGTSVAAPQVLRHLVATEATVATLNTVLRDLPGADL